MNREALAVSLRKPPTKEPAFAEKHYRAQELATAWGMSATAIRKLFRHEPGVKFLGQQGSSSKRSYTTMLIPASVAERVYAALPSSRAVS